MHNRTQLIQFGIATAAGLAGLFANPVNWLSSQNASLVTQAEARIGRPLTPGSIAGVNRRVERRTVRRGYYGYGAGAAVGAAGAYLGSQYYNSYSNQYYGSYPGQYYGSYAYSPDQYSSSESYATPTTTIGDSESCAARFRSYSRKTGTYLGYDGAYHPCP